MNRDEFWSMIEKSRRRWDSAHPDGNMGRQIQDLRELLSALPPAEVASFAAHSAALFDRACRWDLWHAAYMIEQGCSDDGFMDFRAWLISMGRSNYERVLAEVESLVEIADTPGVETVFFEEFMSVPAEVYEGQTGNELDRTASPEEPDGRRIPEAEWAARFPKLWARLSGRQIEDE